MPQFRDDQFNKTWFLGVVFQFRLVSKKLHKFSSVLSFESFASFLCFDLKLLAKKFSKKTISFNFITTLVNETNKATFTAALKPTAKNERYTIPTFFINRK